MVLFAASCLLVATVSAAGQSGFANCRARELNVRDGIGRSAEKLKAGGDFSIAYLGGSITMQNGWRVKFTDYLQKRFPQARIKSTCAGLAGTGSDVGVFRMDDEVLPCNPDLLFVEFATNDTYINPTVIRRAMEGIVRKAWRHNAAMDVVFVYTIADHMTNAYLKGECPRAASVHEAVAEHYGVPTICFGVRVADLLKRGKLVMGLNDVAFPVPEETPDKFSYVSKAMAQKGIILFSKDGTHPVDAGHELYLKSFVESFDRLIAPAPANHSARLAQAPLDAANYEKSRYFPVDRSMLSGKGWEALVKDDPKMAKFGGRMGQIWHSGNVGDTLSFRFRGTAFGVLDLLGPDGCNVEISVDGQKRPNAKSRFNHWTTKKHLLLPSFPFAECADGEHEVTLKITPRQEGSTSFWPSKLMVVGDVCGTNVRCIDWAASAGPVKPVNGVGQPPMNGLPRKASMIHYLKEAGVPYSRLHDVGGAYGQMRYVDIPNVFRDFNADENDPASYDFSYTDRLMDALAENGVEPFYRLGVTIENYPEVGRYRIDPPSDSAKWARIAEHVIRHYTEGWANGRRMKITYWEIWNEPDNYADPEENCMWHGDWKSYMDFYGTVAPYLKAKFPHLKIGGYASCGFYAAVGADPVKAANSSTRTGYFLKCAREFLARARDEKWPLDFFSFHSYSKPGPALQQVRYARQLLDEFGFVRTETCFNEWLPAPGIGNRGSARQAAMIAAELAGLQNGPCDTAMIYDARCGTGNYSPLFNPLTEKPHKAYYAFVAFNELRKLGTAAKVKGAESGGLYVVAARNSMGKTAVMVANCEEKPVPLDVDFKMDVRSCRITDDARTYEPIALPRQMPANSFILVEGEVGARNALVLARRGASSEYRIVVPDAPSPCLRHAAEELSKYVKSMTGVEIPVDEYAKARGAVIRLSSGAELGRDSFRFRTKGNDFVIEGDDDRSVLFGVYDFLENHCGCEWLTPDQEIVPSRETVSVPRGLDVLRRPAFENRENSYVAVEGCADLCAKLKLNGYAFARKYGWEDIHGGKPALIFDSWLGKCHTFMSLLPPERYFKSHPEYYAEVDGKRRGEGRVQLCLTNPDVIRIVTSNLLARIAQKYPEVKVYGVSQSDCWDYCRCASCAAVDAREGSHAGSNIEFVNAVADAVAKKYPDVIIETLAYEYTRKPPKNVRPRPNVMICLCTDTCDFSKPLRETRFRYRGENDFVEDLKAWCAMSKYVHVWDYTMNFRYTLHAFPNIYSLKPNLETFLDCGVKEVYEEGGSLLHQAGSALKRYLIGHLLWDPRQPLEPLLDRFYAGYYGAAAPWMRRYMEELHAMSRARDERKHPMMMWGVIDSPALKTEFFERGAGYIAKAAEAVKDDPVRLRNVQWEMNANDYTRIMRANDICNYVLSRNGAYPVTPHLKELQAAARRMLADWDAVPKSGVVSEESSIRKMSRKRLERYANFDPSKAKGKSSVCIPAADFVGDVNKGISRLLFSDILADTGSVYRVEARIKVEVPDGAKSGDEVFRRWVKNNPKTGIVFRVRDIKPDADGFGTYRLRAATPLLPDAFLVMQKGTLKANLTLDSATIAFAEP